MKKTIVAEQNTCQICGKTISVAYNRPHSLHKTKRTVKANIQKIRGLMVCTRCLRTKIKKESF